MKFIDFCPICAGKNLISYQVNISPFLGERMFLDNSMKDCLFVHCEDCDFYFHNIRPEPNEMSRFYAGYRGEAYQKQRQKHEPNYTAELNAMIGNNPVEIQNRINALEEVLSRNRVSFDVSVLDYGGNDGRLIPTSISGKKFCFDLSNNDTVAGVINLKQEELFKNKYDLIMVSHVLEHVSYPKEVLCEVSELIQCGSYLYIELPYERAAVKEVFQGNIGWKGALKGAFKRYRPKWLFPSMSFGLNPCLHEHINSFNEKSLAKLVSLLGFHCNDLGVKRMSLGWTEIDILYCLARKN
jgi:hypothetical protein